MIDFLFWIGSYNILGAVVLISFNSTKIGDTLLRKYTEIINEPYTHGAFGKLWLWWAATANLFLGMIMCLATRWGEAIQKEVILLVLVTYGIMYLVMFLGARRPKYGRGIYITHLLWIAQITWGIIVLCY